jgi:hypothetical protein
MIADKKLAPVFKARSPARLAHYLVVPDDGARSREIATVTDWLLQNR